MIYKICPAAEWTQAVERHRYDGSPLDRKDGFIHFSGGAQVAGTLAKYYAEANDLVLVAVDPGELGEVLRFEAARDGALFPHLYAALPLDAVRWVKPLTRGTDGVFVLPPDLGE
jgi:uncharacterized protein (DUF952 family)